MTTKKEHKKKRKNMEMLVEGKREILEDLESWVMQ